MSDTRDSGGVVGGDAPGRTTPSARKRLSNRIVAVGAGALIGGVVVAGAACAEATVVRIAPARTISILRGLIELPAV